jgi:hypothetical protein
MNYRLRLQGLRDGVLSNFMALIYYDSHHPLSTMKLEIIIAAQNVREHESTG